MCNCETHLFSSNRDIGEGLSLLMSVDSTTLLRIYLQDQDAALIISQRIARRSGTSNRGTELGDLLSRLWKQLLEDSASLEEIMSLLGIRPSRVKRASTWGAEKLGRMKLNGRLIRYSDLSRVYEIESLLAFLGLKRSLWAALKQNFPEALGSVDMDALIAKATRQLEELEPHREAAAKTALGGKKT